ncbi:MAG: helix-turn-helix domain-containing protein [Clostridiales bacterium]|jgi:transcriptional regulator with XRE-family HTH domain|nr:helix-turn-helix domain-containing protein [Clostridiales bacterium]
MEIAARLKTLRGENRKTQREVAKGAGVIQASYCRWEKGSNIPSVADLMKLAVYFDVSIDYIVGLEKEDGTKNYEAFRK